MQSLKGIFVLFFCFILIACNSTAPDFTGQWEQVNDGNLVKRTLTITSDGNRYQIIDELKDTSTGEVTYDEKSIGTLDGDSLLTGTNTLTNVLKLEKESKQLVMDTYDETTLRFIKIN